MYSIRKDWRLCNTYNNNTTKVLTLDHQREKGNSWDIGWPLTLVMHRIKYKHTRTHTFTVMCEWNSSSDRSNDILLFYASFWCALWNNYGATRIYALPPARYIHSFGCVGHSTAVFAVFNSLIATFEVLVAY